MYLHVNISLCRYCRLLQLLHACLFHDLERQSVKRTLRVERIAAVGDNTKGDPDRIIGFSFLVFH